MDNNNQDLDVNKISKAHVTVDPPFRFLFILSFVLSSRGRPDRRKTDILFVYLHPSFPLLIPLANPNVAELSFAYPLPLLARFFSLQSISPYSLSRENPLIHLRVRSQVHTCALQILVVPPSLLLFTSQCRRTDPQDLRPRSSIPPNGYWARFPRIYHKVCFSLPRENPSIRDRCCRPAHHFRVWFQVHFHLLPMHQFPHLYQCARSSHSPCRMTGPPTGYWAHFLRRSLGLRRLDHD